MLVNGYMCFQKVIKSAIFWLFTCDSYDFLSLHPFAVLMDCAFSILSGL